MLKKAKDVSRVAELAVDYQILRVIVVLIAGMLLQCINLMNY